MKKRYAIRPLAFLLSLVLLLSTWASALTPEQAGTLLSTYYIDPVPQEVLDQDTIEKMLEVLGDPYTEYFTPEEYAAFTASMLDTTLVGIGITSQNAGNGLLLTSVIPGSPAEQGGLAAGDIITAIDGHSTIGENSAVISTWISGEAGSEVTITYEREGKSETVTLRRAVITIPAASTELVDGHIGSISCSTFGEDTTTHITEGVTALKDQADHWIIDLRDNGGGVVGDALQSAGVFTGAGVLGYLRNGAGRYSMLGSRQEAVTSYPAIVLTNHNTASASELFASAIRDGGAGIMVGGRTFGKGVAQSLFDKDNMPEYFADGSGMKITSQRFFAANGAATDTVGVIPHLMVDPELAEDVARLLSDTGPKENTEGYLQLDLSWRWYIKLEDALKNQAAFAALLEAIPSNAQLLEGTGGPDGWQAVTPAALASAYSLPCTFRGFSDSAGTPYSQEIDLLATYGLVTGSGDGTYRPADLLNRAQLCALLVQALNCRAYKGESQFTDVSMDAWYGGAVNTAAAMGLVNGVGDERFDPEAQVDHQQFITIMGRLSKILNMGFYEAKGAFLDVDPLVPYASWAREGVWLLSMSQKTTSGVTLNLLWDRLDSIAPTAATNRGEAAALVYNLFSYAGILPV